MTTLNSIYEIFPALISMIPIQRASWNNETLWNSRSKYEITIIFQKVSSVFVFNIFRMKRKGVIIPKFLNWSVIQIIARRSKTYFEKIWRNYFFPIYSRGQFRSWYVLQLQYCYSTSRSDEKQRSSGRFSKCWQIDFSVFGKKVWASCFFDVWNQ